MHPDPTICRVGDQYFLATSTFGLFPGIPLYRSSDLRDWQFVRHIISRPQQLPFKPEHDITSAGMFAPTLRHDGKRFYLICTNIGNGGHFIVFADNPADEWSDPVWIDADHQGGIDPSITFLQSGEALLQSTPSELHGEARGIHQFEIDPQTGQGLSPRQHISTGYGWKCVEGPHLFQRDEFWYLLTAEGGTEANHRVAIGRSESPWGPWESCPHNPILTNAGFDSPIQNIGHADFFADPQDNWWVVFLGVRTVGYPTVHITGRETFIAPVNWSHGWPIVNNGNPIQLADTQYSNDSPQPWTDNFTSAKLSPHWVTLGCSYQTVYRLDGEAGLALTATSSSLSTAGRQAFIGTRLNTLNGFFECDLSITDQSESEAGLAVLMNRTGYYSLGIERNSQGAIQAVFKRRVLDMETIKTLQLAPAKRYRIRVELNPDNEFVFSILDQNEAWITLGSGAARLLSTEVIGGFTGLLVGPYCISRESGAEARVFSFSAKPE